MKCLSRLAVAAVVASAVATLLGGCLVSREDDYVVTLNEDGRSGTLSVVQYDVQSDQQEAAKQQKDFDELLRRWKSDEYLLERAKDGVYVKSRALERKGRELLWRETDLFPDITEVFTSEISGETLHVSIDSVTTVLGTNGALARSGNRTVVSWPSKTRRLELRIRHDDFHPTTDFAAEFRKQRH